MDLRIDDRFIFVHYILIDLLLLRPEFLGKDFFEGFAARKDDVGGQSLVLAEPEVDRMAQFMRESVEALKIGGDLVLLPFLKRWGIDDFTGGDNGTARPRLNDFQGWILDHFGDEIAIERGKIKGLMLYIRLLAREGTSVLVGEGFDEQTNVVMK